MLKRQWGWGEGGTWASWVIHSIKNPSRSTLTHTTTSQIYTNLSSDNIQQKHDKKALKKQENLQQFLPARHPPKFAFFKFSHLAPCSFCQAPAGIWEQSVKSNSSSSVDWLKACRRSAAPSAPFVCLLKHLQCFVRIDLSKTLWDYDKCRYTIHLKTNPGQLQLQKSELEQFPTETVYIPSWILNPSRSTATSQIWQCSYHNFTNLTTPELEQFPNTRRKKNKKTLNHFSLRGTLWNLPSSSLATWHHAVFATLLPGSDDRVEDPRRPSCSIAKSWRNPKHHVLRHVLQKRWWYRGRRLEGARDTSSPQGIGKWPEWDCPCRP